MLLSLPCPQCGATSVEEIGREGDDRTIRVMGCATCAAIYDELDQDGDPVDPDDSWCPPDGADDPDEPEV